MINIDSIPLTTQSAMLNNILAAFDGKTISKELAASLVGGVKKLESLIASGKIEADKPTFAQNGKWNINAAQTLCYCKRK